MSRKTACAYAGTTTRLLPSLLPLEILLLIAELLDLKDLRSMTITCSYMNTTLDLTLYKRAMATGVYSKKFIYAVIWGRAAAISKFLKAGVLMVEFENRFFSYTAPNSRCFWGDYVKCNPTYDWHPLDIVMLFSHIDVLRVLILEGNMKIEIRGEHRITAVSYAIQHNRLDMLKLLLDQGAKVMTESDDGYPFYSPLALTAQDGNKDAVEMIYSELQSRSVSSGSILDECQRACIQACNRGFTEIVKFFLVKGVDVNSPDDEGYHLLYHAFYGIQLPIVKLLVKHWARMENEMETGVINAYSCYHSPKVRHLVKYLLKSGFDVANGRRHACALWRLAHGFYGRPQHDRGLIYLLRKKGFNKVNCRDQFWVKNRYCFRGKDLMDDSFLKYVEGRQPDA